MTPKSIQALSISPRAKTWLKHPSGAHILHVFRQACNIISDQGLILSIVASPIGNGPFSLVTESTDFSTVIHPENDVQVSTDKLSIGELAINLQNAKLWNPSPAWKDISIHQEKILSLAPLIKEYLIVNSSPDSLVQSFTSPPISDLNPLIDKINAGLDSFKLGIKNDDSQQSLIGARMLLGLGIGLTPSGDDLLIGAIHALWAFRGESAKHICEPIAQLSRESTTSISSAWLASASTGEATEPWHLFFQGIIARSQTKMLLGLDKIIAAGHTSGSDALIGFILTLEAIGVKT